MVLGSLFHLVSLIPSPDSSFLPLTQTLSSSLDPLSPEPQAPLLVIFCHPNSACHLPFQTGPHLCSLKWSRLPSLPFASIVTSSRDSLIPPTSLSRLARLSYLAGATSDLRSADPERQQDLSTQPSCLDCQIHLPKSPTFSGAVPKKTFPGIGFPDHSAHTWAGLWTHTDFPTPPAHVLRAHPLHSPLHLPSRTHIPALPYFLCSCPHSTSKTFSLTPTQPRSGKLDRAIP